MLFRIEAAVHIAVFGVLYCNNGRSKVRSHHSQTFRTTIASRSTALLPAPPLLELCPLYPFLKMQLVLSTRSSTTAANPTPYASALSGNVSQSSSRNN